MEEWQIAPIKPPNDFRKAVLPRRLIDETNDFRDDTNDSELHLVTQAHAYRVALGHRPGTEDLQLFDLHYLSARHGRTGVTSGFDDTEIAVLGPKGIRSTERLGQRLLKSHHL